MEEERLEETQFHGEGDGDDHVPLLQSAGSGTAKKPPVPPPPATLEKPAHPTVAADDHNKDEKSVVYINKKVLEEQDFKNYMDAYTSFSITFEQEEEVVAAERNAKANQIGAVDTNYVVVLGKSFPRWVMTQIRGGRKRGLSAGTMEMKEQKRNPNLDRLLESKIMGKKVCIDDQKHNLIEIRGGRKRKELATSSSGLEPDNKVFCPETGCNRWFKSQRGLASHKHVHAQEKELLAFKAKFYGISATSHKVDDYGIGGQVEHSSIQKASSPSDQASEAGSCTNLSLDLNEVPRSDDDDDEDEEGN